MQWKQNARRRPITRLESVGETLAKPIHRVGGKLVVNRDHTRDLVRDGQVAASITFRRGEYILPAAYVHKRRRFLGYTRDAKVTSRGWAIYLDAVLTDKSGQPVLVDGCEVDLSGWYLEDSLRDAGIGAEPIKLGATVPSESERLAAKVAAAR